MGRYLDMAKQVRPQEEPRREAVALPDEARGLTPGTRVRSLVSACPGQGVVLATGFRSGPHGPFAAVRFDDGLLVFVAEDCLEVVSG